jgi:uncharacterized iron-regulated membrane protein
VKRKVKRSFAVHHWCGLIAGSFLLVLSLTGSILVFDDDIDNAVFRSHKALAHPATTLSFDRSFEKVRSENPGWEIRVPEIPADNHEAILYELRQGKLRKWLFAHPETGEILSQVDRADLRFTYILLNIHYNLLSGTTGKIIVAITGISFLTLLITGLIVYRKSLLKVILFRQKISFKSSRTLFSSLHRVVGVWGLLFNLLMCFSGLWLAYLVIDNAFKKKNTVIDPPALSYSIDEALQHARDSFPDFEITYLRFPVNATGKLQLLGHLNSDPVYYGKHYSGIPLNSEGKIEGTTFLKDQPMSMRAFRILQPLHFGDYAGLAVKIIYTIGGLLPGLLSVTGFFIWRKRHKPHPTPVILAQNVA